jgi:hypothetical protein
MTTGPSDWRQISRIPSGTAGSSSTSPVRRSTSTGSSSEASPSPFSTVRERTACELCTERKPYPDGASKIVRGPSHPTSVQRRSDSSADPHTRWTSPGSLRSISGTSPSVHPGQSIPKTLSPPSAQNGKT